MQLEETDLFDLKTFDIQSIDEFVHDLSTNCHKVVRTTLLRYFIKMDDGSETIRVADLKKFISDCFCTMGVSKAYSEIMSESLVGADLIGHHSHGVFRLDKFIEDGQKGALNVHGEPLIMKETSATAWVDGKCCLGAVVGTFCMKIAIEKAKQVGAAIVSANNSNNFGVASFYSTQALKEGLLGFCFTNSSPFMVATRSKVAVSGTNPITLAAPGLFGDYFLLDMATTVTSGGNIELKYKEGQFLPVGWAVNAACLPETNADVALKTARFLPLGSTEELGSYKGSGLSLMIDILCGVLSGAHYSNMVGVWIGRSRAQQANVGHCFIVIDPKRFAPDFEVRLTELMSHLRGLHPENPDKPVKVPGDRGREIMKSIAETGGITYPKYVVDIIKKMAKSLKLKCVPFIPKKTKIETTSSAELSAHLEAEKLVKEVSPAPTVESLAVPENSVDDKEEIPFVLEDSSDWLCPVSGFTYERDRATSIIKEKLSKYSAEGVIKHAENILAENSSDRGLEKDDHGVEPSTDSKAGEVSTEVKKSTDEEEIEIRMEIDGEIHITGIGNG